MIAAIPKTWIPVEQGDVSKSVREMIVTALRRSAVVAWDAQPHAEQTPSAVVSSPEARGPTARPAVAEDEKPMEKDKLLEEPPKGNQMVVMPPLDPSWADISHNGWASPTSPDLPNLEYHTVVSELPNLIEARAVSLASPDPESSADPPLPDLRAVGVLQRPASMGLRDYITHLTSFSVVPAASSSLVATFLTTYEYARFAGRPLSETQFRKLMKEFAEILRIMQPLSPDVLATLNHPPESDIDDDGTSTPTASLSRSHSHSRSVASFSHSVITRNISPTDSEGTIHTAPSRPRNGMASRELSTAPVSPARSRKRPSASKKSSYNSFAQSRAPYADAGSSGASTESLRSSPSQGSVIKLSQSLSRNVDEGEEEELPYVLNIPGR